MSTSLMPTLTERYIAEVLRHLPANQRADVAAELRDSIAEAVADHGPGDTPGDTERAAIVALGDPIRLAARYADRPVALIGPGLYPQYVRTARTLLTVVPPIVGVVVLAAGLIAEHSVGQAVTSAVGTTVMVALQVLFWTTVGFAVAERTAVQPAPWTPDDLPQSPDPDARVATAETLAAVAFGAALVGVLLWQRVAAQPWLNPDLWSTPPVLWVVTGLLVAGLLLSVVALARGTWTPALAIGNIAVDLGLIGCLGWLRGQQITAQPGLVPDIGWTLVGLGIVAVLLADAYDSWRHRARSPRQPVAA